MFCLFFISTSVTHRFRVTRINCMHNACTSDIVPCGTPSISDYDSGPHICQHRLTNIDARKQSSEHPSKYTALPPPLQISSTHPHYVCNYASNLVSHCTHCGFDKGLFSVSDRIVFMIHTADLPCPAARLFVTRIIRTLDCVPWCFLSMYA